MCFRHRKSNTAMNKFTHTLFLELPWLHGSYTYKVAAKLEGSKQIYVAGTGHKFVSQFNHYSVLHVRASWCARGVAIKDIELCYIDYIGI
jgi:hypothetical protein